MKSFLTTIFSLLVSFLSLAQQNITLNGRILNSRSGEGIKDVSIKIDIINKSLSSDTYGYFKCTLPASYFHFTFTRLGYATLEHNLILVKDTFITFTMTEEYRELKELVVLGKRSDEKATNRISTIDLKLADLNKIPALVGEKDFIKAMALMPGVQSGSEGSADIFVRGGSSDQNLYLLDNATLYHSGHLFGFLSSFNPLVIENAKLYKASFPARFGGRLSSIIDIQTKNPNADSLKADLDIGVISSKLCVEVPIVRKKLSFMVAARRTYADALISSANLLSGNQNVQSVNFLDLNAKLYWRLKRNKISFNIYGDRDTFFSILKDENIGIYNEGRVTWKNKSANIVWERPVGKFNQIVQAGYTGYEMNFKNILKNKEINEESILNSSINDLYIRQQADVSINDNIVLKGGMQYTAHRFAPSSLFYKDYDTTLTFRNIPLSHMHEMNIHAEADIETSEKLSFNLGLRNSWFITPGKVYSAVEPRIIIKYNINSQSSVNASYSRMVQPVHLLTNAGLGMPVNIWIPATARMAPQTSDQYSLTYTNTKNKEADPIMFTAEVFYKQMNRIIAYRDGFSSTSFLNPFSYASQWENTFITGRGYAYGFELTVQKKAGDFTGLAGYTWGHVKNKFEALNSGNWFNATQDIRHSIILSGSQKITTKWSVGLNWVFRTGRPVTLPILTYNDVDLNYSNGKSGSKAEHYNSAFSSQLFIGGPRNSIRMLNYHRLDISFSKNIRVFKRFSGVFEFGVYNAYNRKNPYYYYVKTETDNGYVRKAVKSVSLFPIIPNISLQVQF